ncbi:ATP-dependent helicase [Trueperella pyogenes]
MNKWDESQRAVLELRAPCVVSVIGAPGTGKTSLAVELAVRIMRKDPQAQVAVLSPDRRAASDLRNRIGVELGYLPGSLHVQSLTAFGFGIVSSYSQFIGRREPELISGPAQDALIKEQFELAIELGQEGFDEESVRLPAYRAEFRDLLTRAAELEISPKELRALAERYNEESWKLGADLITDYEKALATQSAVGHANPDLVDHARVLTQAATMLRGWEHATPLGEGRLDIAKPHWDWVIVDDVQNATLAVRTLLRALREDGASVVTFGDPDVAVQGFRGGIAHLPALLTKPARGGGIGAERMILSTRYRAGGQILQTVEKIVSGVHTAGVGKHRAARYAGEADTRVRAAVFPHEDEELAFIATELRRLHLFQGVPYSRMAVITRSTSAHPAIRRSLIHYGIPVQTIVNTRPLREQRAVAALIDLIEIALADGEIGSERIEAMLTGVLFAIDSVQLRRLRRELRGWELAAGGRRSHAELLEDIVLGGEIPAKVPEFARVSAVLDAIRRADAHGLGEEVLWAAWDGVGVAQRWREQALAGGPEGDVADEDLDAVLSLFRIAQRQADRDVTNATTRALLELLENQDLPEDSIARMGAGADEVALVSPAATIGCEWSHVAIVGLNDGAWPNTQLRNPLTKVPKLVNIVVGSAMAGAEVEPTQLVRDVIDDELRMLAQAVSRAREEVIFTAQEQDGVRPSRFLSWLFPELPRAETIPTTLDEGSLVGQLRQADKSGHPELERAAQALLAELAAAGIRVADPSTWVDQFELSTDAPVIEGASGISPSRVESLLTCPLAAFLDQSNARSEDTGSALDIGTLIHALAEHYPAGPRAAIEEEFERRIAQIEFPDGLEGQRLVERVRAMVDKLCSYLESRPAAALVEQSAKATVVNGGNEINVRARIDRLEEVAGGVRIVDFKTGKTAITKEAAKTNPQLRLYQWLVGNGGLQNISTSIGAQLVYVGTSTKEPTIREQQALTPEDTKDTLTMICRADEAQRGPDFAALTGPQCLTCAYSASCPAQGTGRIFS